MAVGEQTVSAQRRAHAVPTFGLQHGRGMAQSTEREQRMREMGAQMACGQLAAHVAADVMLIRFLSQGSGESRSC